MFLVSWSPEARKGRLPKNAEQLGIEGLHVDSVEVVLSHFFLLSDHLLLEALFCWVEENIHIRELGFQVGVGYCLAVMEFILWLDADSLVQCISNNTGHQRISGHAVTI